MNLIGVGGPLRNDAIYAERANSHGPDDIVLSEEDALSDLVRMPTESTLDYALRATRIVNRGMAHYWWDAGVDKYRIRIPLWENWLLYLPSLWDPAYFRYKFMDGRRALARGVGMCGQQSIVLLSFLQQAGVEARAVTLRGHSLTTVEVEPGVWHMMDPDYGAHVPLSLAEIEENPERVRTHYVEPFRRIGRSGPELDRIVGFYGAEGNRIERLEERYPHHASEARAYRLKWAIPLALVVAPGAALAASRRRANRRLDA